MTGGRVRRIAALFLAVCMTVLGGCGAVPGSGQGGGTPRFPVERLDRGTLALDMGGCVYVSWRLLASDDPDTAFDVYRDGVLIATVWDTADYSDPDGGPDSLYEVVPAGDMPTGDGIFPWDGQCLRVPLDRPEGGVSLDGEAYEYLPNDAVPADLDGDGQYEIILKWDPSNSFDSGTSARYSGNVYIDAYELDGTLLWRIDLGININAGAHFTQIAAYDFDGDGKAELAMKTAPGSKDGAGRYVTEASLDPGIRSTDNGADCRHGIFGGDTGGRVLSGPEYYTVFRGDTGEAIDTIRYPFLRGSVFEWGDSWGNRSERYLSCVAYLGGENASMVAWRGYYGRTAAAAYDLVGGWLVERARFDTAKVGNGKYKGNGNHNIAVADADGDGLDEIFCGSLVLDDDLSVLWCSWRGHGDALHLADYDPVHEGFEYFCVHEDPGGMTLYAAESGEELFHIDVGFDVGRGMMAAAGFGDGYFEMWGRDTGTYVSYGGSDVKESDFDPGSVNWRIFWDGDLYDELMDGTDPAGGGGIVIYDAGGELARFEDCVTINGTKNNVCLVADLLGDWREEIVAASADGGSLLIYATAIPAEYRLPALMQDRTYRMQTAAQNAGYNQPPHVGWYAPAGSGGRSRAGKG